MAIVTAVHPGRDGQTRVVTLKTPKGLLQRSVHKLVLLPTKADEKSSAMLAEGGEDVQADDLNFYVVHSLLYV